MVFSGLEEGRLPLLHSSRVEHVLGGIEELLQKSAAFLLLFVLECLENHIELIVVLGENGVEVPGLLLLIPSPEIKTLFFFHLVLFYLLPRLRGI